VRIDRLVQRFDQTVDALERGPTGKDIGWAAQTPEEVPVAHSGDNSWMAILAILIGLMTGVVSGLIGIGGGIFLVPALVYLFKMSQHEAQGTSLATLLLPIGLFGVWEYYRHGQVDVRIAALLALGFAIGHTRSHAASYLRGNAVCHCGPHVVRALTRVKDPPHCVTLG
jgi:hypothetical protein